MPDRPNIILIYRGSERQPRQRETIGDNRDSNDVFSAPLSTTATTTATGTTVGENQH